MKSVPAASVIATCLAVPAARSTVKYPPRAETYAVPWPSPAELPTPDGRPILSQRDLSNPALADLVRSLR